jgi:lysozyme family protein
VDTFERAVEVVLKHEGGYVNDPDDPGGETKFGISKRSYPDLDIRNLTEEQARAIYRKDWWDEHGYHRIENADIAAKLLDLAVHVGPWRAHKMLQRAVNASGGHVEVDGWLGPNTVDAVNRHPVPGLILAQLRLQAVRHYADLAQHAARRKFLLGWVRRALD